MLTKKIQMTFLNETNKKLNITVDSPAADVTEAKVKEVMQLIIDKAVFSSKGGKLVKIDSAKFVNHETNEINVK